MKKIIYLSIFLSYFVFSFSCTDNIENEVNQGNLNVANQDAILISSDGNLPDSILRLDAEKYPPQDHNSHLWEKFTNLRAGTDPLTVSGYDQRVLIKTEGSTFPAGLSYDRRVMTGQTYLVSTYYYKKKIQIPKGATLVLPPPSVMGTYPYFGNVPGFKERGYGREFVGTEGSNDTYFLVTEIREMTHDVTGRYIFNPQVYMPEGAGSPSSLLWKYYYQEKINW